MEHYVNTSLSSVLCSVSPPQIHKWLRHLGHFSDHFWIRPCFSDLPKDTSISFLFARMCSFAWFLHPRTQDGLSQNCSIAQADQHIAQTLWLQFSCLQRTFLQVGRFRECKYCQTYEWTLIYSHKVLQSLDPERIHGIPICLIDLTLSTNDPSSPYWKDWGHCF